MRRLLPLSALGLAALLLATPARAEGEEELDPVSAEVKAQMEKIIRLMRENEQALLEISTGGKAKPRQVDVDVPVPPAGKEAARQLEEVVEGQRQTGARIPGELEELVRMVPQ